MGVPGRHMRLEEASPPPGVQPTLHECVQYPPDVRWLRHGSWNLCYFDVKLGGTEMC